MNLPGARRPRPQWLVASLRLNGTWDHWQGDTKVKANERLAFVSKTLAGKYAGHLLVSPDLEVERFGPGGEDVRAPVTRQASFGYNPYNRGS